MKLKKEFFVGMVFLLLGFASCTNRDASPQFRADKIYLDYQMIGDEETGFVTARLQFKLEDEEGPATRIPLPGSVKFNGMVLQGDTASLNGVYYELAQPLETGNENNVVEVNFPDGRSLRDTISFSKIAITTPILPVYDKEDLGLEIAGLPAGRGSIRLIITDTNFTSSWINDTVNVFDSKFTIPGRWLSKLASGPIRLEVQRENEYPLSRRNSAGGKVYTSYTFRKEFELK